MGDHYDGRGYYGARGRGPSRGRGRGIGYDSYQGAGYRGTDRSDRHFGDGRYDRYGPESLRERGRERDDYSQSYESHDRYDLRADPRNGFRGDTRSDSRSDRHDPRNDPRNDLRPDSHDRPRYPDDSRGFRGRSGGRHGSRGGRPFFSDRDESGPGHHERQPLGPSGRPGKHEGVHLRPLHPSHTLYPHSGRDNRPDPVADFNNPWISILQIRDEPMRQKLEASHNELELVNRDIAAALRECWHLQRGLQTLEHHAAREALSVQQTSEKLEELSYV